MAVVHPGATMPPPLPPPGKGSTSNMGPPQSTSKQGTAGPSDISHQPAGTTPESSAEDRSGPRAISSPKKDAIPQRNEDAIAREQAHGEAAQFEQMSAAGRIDGSRGQGRSGVYADDDAYNRSRTPSPILPRLQPLPEVASATSDGHLSFPPFGISQAHMQSILHDPVTEHPDASLMQPRDVEALVHSVRQLTTSLANAEDIQVQQLIHTAKTLGDQALGLSQYNTNLQVSLNNTRINAVSAINALSASASHATIAERDLRQRLQVELDGSRAESRKLAGMVSRANRKLEEDNGADGSGSEAGAVSNASPGSEVAKERNRLLADKRFLKNRVKDLEGQLVRLEQELKALRPVLARPGATPSVASAAFSAAHSVNSSPVGAALNRSYGIAQGHGVISDPFALGNASNTTSPMYAAPPSPKKGYAVSQQRRRAATLGDAKTEHLLLAARRYREITRKLEAASVQDMTERMMHSSQHVGYTPSSAYLHTPSERYAALPISPVPSSATPRNGVVPSASAHVSAHHNWSSQHAQPGTSDARGDVGVNGSLGPQITPSLGSNTGPSPFEAGPGSHPYHAYSQRPMPASSSMAHFGPSYGNMGGAGTGPGAVGPTPRTPPPMHDRLPRAARTDGSISRIRSIPSSPRGSPSSAMRGAEWHRSGSVTGLGPVAQRHLTHGGGAVTGGGPASASPSSAGLFTDLLNAAQSALRPGQEGRALVQSRIQDQRGRRPDLRGLGLPTGSSVGGGVRDAITYERDEDDNDSLPYSEDDSDVDELAGHQQGQGDVQDGSVGDASFAKAILGSPKRRRVSAALNSPSKRMAKGRRQSGGPSVQDSPSKDRTPRPPKGKNSKGSAAAGSSAAALSALDLLADQAAASSTQSQHSGDSGSEHAYQAGGPLSLAGPIRGYDPGYDEDEMDIEPARTDSGSAPASQEKRSTYTRWSAEEDIKLRAAIKQHGQRWELVSRAVETRSYHQCRQRYLLLRRKEAAQNEAGDSANQANNSSASSTKGTSTASNSPRKHRSGSRSGRSNSESDGPGPGMGDDGRSAGHGAKIEDLASDSPGREVEEDELESPGETTMTAETALQPQPSAAN